MGLAEDVRNLKTGLAGTTLEETFSEESPKLHMKNRKALKGHHAKIYAMNWCESAKMTPSARSW